MCPFGAGCSLTLDPSLICCAVLAEHVSSNASDSESSCRKLLLGLVVLSFAVTPVACGPYFRLFSPAASYRHPGSKANGLKRNQHLMWEDTNDMGASRGTYHDLYTQGQSFLSLIRTSAGCDPIMEDFDFLFP